MDLKRELKRKEEELVLSGRGLNTEDQSEDVQELLGYRDDGAIEVHEWVSFQGLAKVDEERGRNIFGEKKMRQHDRGAEVNHKSGEQFWCAGQEPNRKQQEQAGGGVGNVHLCGQYTESCVFSGNDAATLRLEERGTHELFVAVDQEFSDNDALQDMDYA